MLSEGFEEQWRRLLANAKAAKTEFELSCLGEADSKFAERAMYAANSAVRRFVDLENEMRMPNQKKANAGSVR